MGVRARKINGEEPNGITGDWGDKSTGYGRNYVSCNLAPCTVDIPSLPQHPTTIPTLDEEPCRVEADPTRGRPKQ